MASAFKRRQIDVEVVHERQPAQTPTPFGRTKHRRPLTEIADQSLTGS